MKSYKETINEAREAEAGRIIEGCTSVIGELEEAQASMREAAEKLNAARKELESLPMNAGKTTGERIYRYLSGALEPLIDSEHMWLDKSTNVADIIKEVEEIKADFSQEFGEEGEEGEENSQEND